MKIFWSIVLCLLVALFFVACNQQVQADSSGDIFDAIVVDIIDEGFLVMPVEGSKECGAAMKIGLVVPSMDQAPTVHVGDRVRIHYSGQITRSIPGRLGEVYGIKIIH